MDLDAFFFTEPRWLHLDENTQRFFLEQHKVLNFTFQEWQQLLNMATDFSQWGTQDFPAHWPSYEKPSAMDRKVKKKEVLANLTRTHQQKALELRSYPHPVVPPVAPKIGWTNKDFGPVFLGHCPVESQKTRCCQLTTLDAFRSCNFGCAYCSLQSFHRTGDLEMDPHMASKINNLQLSTEKRWHIGTGQNSDSLAFGNHQEVLSALIQLAARSPHAIIEFKTKSHEVDWILQQRIPPNLILTWSLNAPTISAQEEHFTATFEQRIQAARRCADRGILVGFHIHPIFLFDQWETEYAQVAWSIKETFKPEELVMISFGTLTFSKPVLKKIRSGNQKTQVLRMPLEEIAGKFSYPLDTKVEIFSFVFNQFREWKDQVFFFLCMEEQTLWPRVFGWSYPDNEAFEQAMLDFYFRKIESVRLRPQMD